MGKVKAMYMEQEEQIMEWYYDGITLEKAKHLAELSFGPSVIQLVEENQDTCLKTEDFIKNRILVKFYIILAV